MISHRSYGQRAYPKYNRRKKKFPPLLRRKLNEAEDDVTMNPFIGVEKTGPLQGIRVYKFKALDQLILLAYEVDKSERDIIFIAVGGHENFYRDLEQYLKG